MNERYFRAFLGRPRLQSLCITRELIPLHMHRKNSETRSTSNALFTWRKAPLIASDQLRVIVTGLYSATYLYILTDCFAHNRQGYIEEAESFGWNSGSLSDWSMASQYKFFSTQWNQLVRSFGVGWEPGLSYESRHMPKLFEFQDWQRTLWGLFSNLLAVFWFRSNVVRKRTD